MVEEQIEKALFLYGLLVFFAVLLYIAYIIENDSDITCEPGETPHGFLYFLSKIYGTKTIKPIKTRSITKKHSL